jgi:hypothetical protein
MFPTIDKDGKVWVPMTPTPEADGIIGDAMIEMVPDEEGYEQVKAWIEKNAR